MPAVGRVVTPDLLKHRLVAIKRYDPGLIDQDLPRIELEHARASADVVRCDRFVRVRPGVALVPSECQPGDFRHNQHQHEPPKELLHCGLLSTSDG